MNYSVEFFILSDEEKEKLFTYATGEMIEEDERLIGENLVIPGITSEEIFKTTIQDNIKNNFYVEVTITKTNDVKERYQIRLEATEVTQNIPND